MKLTYQTSDGIPGGFVAEHDGYLCFIEPEVVSGRVEFRWAIQEGGGWTHRGGEDVVKLVDGTAISCTQAEKQIEKWLEENA